MLVDPQVLKAFAGEVDGVSDSIKGADVGTKVSTAADGPQAQASDLDADICLTCLGFAQIGGLAKFEVPVAPKLDTLVYHFATEPVRHVAERSLAAARSRGPPRSV